MAYAVALAEGFRKNMRRFALFLMLLLGLGIPTHAYAGCSYYPMYDVVTTDYQDGSSSSVWTFMGMLEYCPPDGGGGYVTPPPGKKGGGGVTPTNLLTQQRTYADSGCATPDATEFLDINGFAASGMGNWTTFSDYKFKESLYVLVNPVLVAGMTSVGTCMDNQMPRNSDPGKGGGYRLPGTNAVNPCGSHMYGRAIDLSIRAVDYHGNNTGAHDCKLWNALAACANAAGGWVEPWWQIVASGALHMHIGFGQPPNTPADYGDACAQ